MNVDPHMGLSNEELPADDVPPIDVRWPEFLFYLLVLAVVIAAMGYLS
jgi:hypothetical protein